MRHAKRHANVNHRKSEKLVLSSRFRRSLVVMVMVVAAGSLCWRAIDIQVVDNGFLKDQGEARYSRVIKIGAHRGEITDRNGQPVAISSPVDSVWVDPSELIKEKDRFAQLAASLSMDEVTLSRKVSQRQKRRFYFIKRHLPPAVAGKVKQLNIPGVYLQREYQRFYPDGEVMAHVVGFTGVDDNGQEGIELLYNDWLTGEDGKKRVIKNRLGEVVEGGSMIASAKPGRSIILSIDRRVQSLAYQQLKKAVIANRAKSGSLVMLDVITGEVIAMVGSPSYNPNNKKSANKAGFRNRSITDVIEPGSTIKPFVVAAALMEGGFHPKTMINTSPGWMKVGRNTIRDVVNLGVIDVTTVLEKSSNVGMTKMALSLSAESLANILMKVGVGTDTGSGFPGETSGMLPNFGRWREIERATASFGYGLAVSPLQLARAYAALANGGVLKPVSFIHLDSAPSGERVMTSKATEQVRVMLEGAVKPSGTGYLGRVNGYKVAGKTGTVRKSSAGGYVDDRYLSLFAGMAPASNPRFAMVVVIDEPNGEEYYGGRVAAPIFSSVMSAALRFFSVPPDDVGEMVARVDRAGYFQ